ncbi:carrier protein ymc1 [Podospora pseudopauciseta]|uniref:Carrier protein ymc1 n=1 Tax=Podospora pseudopauciseta TaxID=2093780 RepID=A0ABR0HA67_9PEZI|nr:carrier protein ymc1 [Podospora pseudopauciseta]
MAAPTTPQDLVLPEPAPSSGGASQTFKDLFSGAAGGIAQVLIGQPFDIVKVRLQTSTLYPSALAAATSIYTTEGPLAFYKGTLTPLLGIGACYYSAGAFAGVANSVLSGPIEHVRIRLQTQPHGPARLYSGPLDCVRQLVRQGGFTHGLYRGQAVTLIREAQAYGLWFLSFEWLMNSDAKRNSVDRKEIPSWKVALYGGLAGEALWLGSYPFDVVKSKMQTDGFGQGQQRYRNMRHCFAQVWRQEGMRGFWKGLGPTLLRAMPVSAGTFAVVEMTMRAIN